MGEISGRLASRRDAKQTETDRRSVQSESDEQIFNRSESRIVGHAKCIRESSSSESGAMDSPFCVERARDQSSWRIEPRRHYVARV